MKWKKSFLLHPWANRFNLLYLGGAFLTWAFVPVDNIGWVLLGSEVAYLGVRSLLDRSANPWLRLRMLFYKDRQRFLQAWAIVDRVEQDMKDNPHMAATMAASRDQIHRLLESFLKMLLMRHRLDMHLRSKQSDYNAEIARTRQRMVMTADANEKQLLMNNIQLLEKRRGVYNDLFKRRQSIDARLDTIENSVRLLGEVSVGLVSPDEVTGQVEVILQNVADAEAFVNELNEFVPPMRVR